MHDSLLFFSALETRVNATENCLKELKTGHAGKHEYFCLELQCALNSFENELLHFASALPLWLSIYCKGVCCLKQYHSGMLFPGPNP